MTVLACPECNTRVHPKVNKRHYGPAGVPVPDAARWICRECNTAFADPERRDPIDTTEWQCRRIAGLGKTPVHCGACDYPNECDGTPAELAGTTFECTECEQANIVPTPT